MKKMTVSLMVLGVTTASAQAVFAAFGIPIDVTLAQFQKMGAKYNTMSEGWILSNALTTNSEYEYYKAKFSPKYGLCYIMGVTKPMTSTPDGAEIRRRFNKMKAELSQKHLKSKDFNSLYFNSTLKASKDWMRALEQGQRGLDAVWYGNKSRLPKGVMEIMLAAGASSSTEGRLYLSYRMDNYIECVADADKASGSGR